MSRGAAAVVGLVALLTAVLAYASGGVLPDAYGLSAVVVLVALVLWITLAPAPLQGLSWPLVVVTGALVAYAVLVLASSAWSDATGRAVLEYVRVLLYGAVLVLFGLAGRSAGAAAGLVRWLTVATTVVAVAALAVWLLPSTFPAEGFSRVRLSWPTSYWNTSGLLIAFGATWALHLSSSPGERGWVRALAAGAIPLSVAALVFTVSRGAVGAFAVAVLIYLAASRSRLLLPALAVAVPAGLFAASAADGLRGLDELDPSAAALDDGRAVAWQLALCAAVAVAARALLLPVDRRLSRVTVDRRLRIGARSVAALGVLAGIVAGVAIGGPAKASDAYDEFLSPEPVRTTGVPSDRLFELGNNGRLDHWRVAVDGFEDRPVAGTGAGTFELLWERGRDTEFSVIDAHSLYVETLAELGVPGLALLVVALGGMLLALAWRSRGPRRHAWAALLATGVALAVHAGIDWDWETPAVTVWLFAAGGLALGGAPERAGDAGRTTRVVAALACLVLAALPALTWRSQTRLVDAVGALRAGDCRTASDAALDSAEALSMRAEPFELLAYCHVRRGDGAAAHRAIDAAIERDPNNWEFHYGRALIVAVTGGDPRPEARIAARLNPQEPLARTFLRTVRASGRAGWRRAGAQAPLPLPADELR